MKTLQTWMIAAAMVALAGTAEAALIDRSGGMIYDTTLNVTWLADWNYAKTQYDNSGGAQGAADGRMTWVNARTWAVNLVYGGYDDWRLPTSLNADGTGPCQGFNCSGSEMGHMFYNNWGASAGSAFSTGTNAAYLALFSNVQSGLYWSGTEESSGFAWDFYTTGGTQNSAGKAGEFYAVAVRAGDVTASAPEPQTLALALLALGATVVARRRRPR